MVDAEISIVIKWLFWDLYALGGLSELCYITFFASRVGDIVGMFDDYVKIPTWLGLAWLDFLCCCVAENCQTSDKAINQTNFQPSSHWISCHRKYYVATQFLGPTSLTLWLGMREWRYRLQGLCVAYIADVHLSKAVRPFDRSRTSHSSTHLTTCWPQYSSASSTTYSFINLPLFKLLALPTRLWLGSAPDHWIASTYYNPFSITKTYSEVKDTVLVTAICSHQLLVSYAYTPANRTCTVRSVTKTPIHVLTSARNKVKLWDECWSTEVCVYGTDIIMEQKLGSYISVYVQDQMIKLRLVISNKSHSKKPQPTLFSFVITCDRRLRKLTQTSTNLYGGAQDSTPSYMVAHLVCQFVVRGVRKSNNEWGDVHPS